MGMVLDLLALLEEGILGGLLGGRARKSALHGGPELRSKARGSAEAKALGNHDRCLELGGFKRM